MRALLAIPLLFVAVALAIDHQFVSPNGEFDAYTTAAKEDGTGMKLYLRRANSRAYGRASATEQPMDRCQVVPELTVPCCHRPSDGHISDVYVFGVAAANAAPTLLYHTPDLHKYDVKWEVTGWNVARRQIILDKEVKHEMPGRITNEKIEAPVGTEPLKYEPTE